MFAELTPVSSPGFWLPSSEPVLSEDELSAEDELPFEEILDDETVDVEVVVEEDESEPG